MGLDCYIYELDQEFVIDAFNIKPLPEPICIKPDYELVYYRNHHELHRIMRRLYRRKGGRVEDDFNCQYVQINEQDLLFLSKDLYWVDAGFYSDSNKLKKDFTKMTESLKKGKALYYYGSF
jgi:hypothetical protein